MIKPKRIVAVGAGVLHRCVVIRVKLVKEPTCRDIGEVRHMWKESF